MNKVACYKSTNNECLELKLLLGSYTFAKQHK